MNLPWPTIGNFAHPQHKAVISALIAMNHRLLRDSKCWFGGGTEIVLDVGEYRISRDIDFLCADQEGYRTLRALAVAGNIAAFLGAGVRNERPFKVDQYGIRGIITSEGQQIRIEIVREARIALTGRPTDLNGVPRLSASDRITEKLLANADRCRDRSVAYRDAADLAILALYRGPFPVTAFAKATDAYGDDVAAKLTWAMERLGEEVERKYAATALGMNPILLETALSALAGEIGCLKPPGFPDFPLPIPPHPRETHMVELSSDGCFLAIRKRPVFGMLAGELDNPWGAKVLTEAERLVFPMFRPPVSEDQI